MYYVYRFRLYVGNQIAHLSQRRFADKKIPTRNRKGKNPPSPYQDNG